MYSVIWLVTTLVIMHFSYSSQMLDSSSKKPAARYLNYMAGYEHEPTATHPDENFRQPNCLNAHPKDMTGYEHEAATVET